MVEKQWIEIARGDDDSFDWELLKWSGLNVIWDKMGSILCI